MPHTINETVRFDDELERMYQTTQREKGWEHAPRMGASSLEEIVLGDAAYGRRFRMPKWNIQPTMLQEHKIAIRHNRELGIPTSKSAHQQRAEHFTELYHEIGRTYTELVKFACEEYGDHGPLVSGIVHSHFPTDIKNRLRFLSAAKNMVGDAARLHEYLSKTRSAQFR